MRAHNVTPQQRKISQEGCCVRDVSGRLFCSSERSKQASPTSMTIKEIFRIKYQCQGGEITPLQECASGFKTHCREVLSLSFNMHTHLQNASAPRIFASSPAFTCLLSPCITGFETQIRELCRATAIAHMATVSNVIHRKPALACCRMWVRIVAPGDRATLVASAPPYLK